MRFCTVLLWASSLLAPVIASAEPTNFRVGIGAFQADVSSTSQGLPNGQHTGHSLFGEFPQNNYTASRFIMYSLQGHDGLRLYGAETQLMWGIGLAQPGFRLYTGPAWHYEKMKVPSTGSSRTHTLNGWGWQVGTGVQYQAITVDVAATYRDQDDYNKLNQRLGHQKSDAWVYNLLLSYRF